MARKSCESRKRASLRCWCSSKKRPLPEPPISAGCFLPSIDQFTSLILPRCGCKRISWIVAASNREATGLRRECVNLICALSYVALRGFRWHWWFEDVGACGFRELVKRQGLLFLLSQASHRFWVALAVFGLEGVQLDHGFLFAWLIPDANELSLNITSLSSGNGIQDVALLMRPASVDEVWPKTVLSLLPVVHHDHRSRTDRSGSLLVFAGLASLAGPSILAFLRAG